MAFDRQLAIVLEVLKKSKIVRGTTILYFQLSDLFKNL